jgi:ABC-type Fe3+/spermidine/putrescine transport system ATPase subunit
MLKVSQVYFSYQQDNLILKDISFQLKEGEHLCIMGESGSGKSTLLKAIYGLLDLNNGDIYWKDQQVLGPAHHLVPGMEFFKYVPQNFDLMPYTTVSENIQKFLSRFFPEESQKRTVELLEVIEMSEFADVKVKNLSGGQQQRVAIARALAKEPQLILLDEPFSQIDNFKKNSLRRKLFAYLKQKNISCIVATHDGNDSLSFADSMMVIKDNQILAYGTPQHLYNRKNDVYIASLFDDVSSVSINGNVHLFYPKDIKITDKSEYKVTVKQSYFKGVFWLIEAELNGAPVFLNSTKPKSSGDTIYLDFPSIEVN